MKIACESQNCIEDLLSKDIHAFGAIFMLISQSDTLLLNKNFTNM